MNTHSFRRTALTQMSNAEIPLRIIQEISGHRTLDELYKYLEVSPEQVRGAIAALSMLTPLSRSRHTSGNPFFCTKEPKRSRSRSYDRRLTHFLLAQSVHRFCYYVRHCSAWLISLEAIYRSLHPDWLIPGRMPPSPGYSDPSHQDAA